MKQRKPGDFKKEIAHTAECAFQRAIIQGRYSFVKGEKIEWIDIELPVDDSTAQRGRCVDLIGKDSNGNYVLCELKFRKKSDNGSPQEAIKQLKDYYLNIKKNAVALNKIKLKHTNSNGNIDWEKVADPTTRLFIVANSFYWETWLCRKKEKLIDEEVECYSVNVDRNVFERQKGDNTRYSPTMPKEGMKWEMKPDYYQTQKKHQVKLLETTDFFEGAKGGGLWKGKKRFVRHPFILHENDEDKNLYAPIREEAKKYFVENEIRWWQAEYEKVNKISGHLLSSQVACLNHLFPLRKDPDAVLSIVNGIDGLPVRFKEVIPIKLDKEEGYIAFEVVSSKDYLNEGKRKRGSKCTSIDALVYAVDEKDERWLIPIEWKYTEPGKDSKGTNFEGYRLIKYCNIKRDNLIGNSRQLKSLDNYQGSIYFQEPFYQLMRQTLWAERICESKDETVIPAEHFVHIHVCPKANVELLERDYTEVSQKHGMEAAWREMLTDQSLYHLVYPKDLMKPIKGNYPDLYEYLETRYWKD